MDQGYINIENEIYTLMITENKREIIYDSTGKFVSTKPLELYNGELVKKEPQVLYYLPKQKYKTNHTNKSLIVSSFDENFSNLSNKIKKYSTLLGLNIITILNNKEFLLFIPFMIITAFFYINQLNYPYTDLNGLSIIEEILESEIEFPELSPNPFSTEGYIEDNIIKENYTKEGMSGNFINT